MGQVPHPRDEKQKLAFPPGTDVSGLEWEGGEGFFCREHAVLLARRPGRTCLGRAKEIG